MMWIVAIAFAFAQEPAAPEPAPTPAPAPTAPSAPAATAKPVEEAPAASPDAAAPPPDVEGEAPADEAVPSEELTPRPPPPIDERYVQGQPLLGPWSDGWVPEASAHQILPAVDPLTFDVVHPGEAPVAGPVLGPDPPPDATSSDDAVAPAPPTDSVPVALIADESPVEPSAIPVPAVVEPPPPPVPHAVDSPTLLPARPAQGLDAMLGFTSAALLLLLCTRVAEHLAGRLPGSGRIRWTLQTGAHVTRALSVPLFLLGLVAILPRPLAEAVPYVLVGVAFAVGWTSRDLVSDLFAGAILSIERGLSVRHRIQVGEHSGTVTHMGPRATVLETDDGVVLTIPNREIMRSTVRHDADVYPRVVVNVHVMGNHKLGEVRHVLEELALCSPYIAPSRPPRVFRNPDHAHVWVVEVRLVDSRYANAFRGAMVEQVDEVFAARTEEALCP